MLCRAAPIAAASLALYVHCCRTLESSTLLLYLCLGVVLVSCVCAVFAVLVQWCGCCAAALWLCGLFVW